jgi:CheY-like chemotaxis protein
MSEPSEAARSAGRRARSVVIVDDDADTLELAREILEHDDWSVRTFAEPVAALAAIEAAPPDVVVTDLRMEAGGGIELARAIRRSASGPLRIVAVTGEAAERDGDEFDGWFQKPLDWARFSDDLRAVCERPHSGVTGRRRP